MSLFLWNVQGLHLDLFIYFLHVNVLFQCHLFENYPFFIELPVLLSQRSAGCICVGLFLGSLFLDTDLSAFSLIPYCLYYCSFIISKSCAVQHVVSWPGIKPMPPAVALQSLNWVKLHLREVPGLLKWSSKLEQGKKSKFHLENTTVHFWCFPSFPECLAQFFTIGINKKNDCVSETKRMRSDINLINAYKHLRGRNGDQYSKCFCCCLFCWNAIKINYGKWNLFWLVKKSRPWPMRLNFPVVLSRHYH